ncbi:MAG TPA: hypothetical protein VF447_15335 [Terriglobales bacterium]
MHRPISLAVLLVLLLLLIQPGLTAQQQDAPNPNPPQAPQGQTIPGDHDDNGIPSDMRKAMEKKANEQRQAQLKRDTDRLLKLSQELKAYVDKSNENILSLDVIKKADEIEKLAHSVKTKMRGGN